jgi:hypothetical protein
LVSLAISVWSIRILSAEGGSSVKGDAVVLDVMAVITVEFKLSTVETRSSMVRVNSLNI